MKNGTQTFRQKLLHLSSDCTAPHLIRHLRKNVVSYRYGAYVDSAENMTYELDVLHAAVTKTTGSVSL